jgi:glycosyltransferase involved in cell wall biosynthesis
MFSIIIPLYNKALYIEKAIQSVLVQTYQKFELIIVDDGSTDNSLEIVKNFQFSTFDFKLIEQQNSGVSTARNNGVKAAKYDYIAFLDADDWWDEHFLEEMKALIEAFPDAAMYGCSYFIVKNGRNRISPIALPPNFSLGYIDYIKTYSDSGFFMPITSITAVLKKSVFDEIDGFKPQLKLGEDFDVWMRISLKYKVAFLNKPLAYYNQDVELQNKATGKQQNPQDHILWHLDEFEQISHLKQFLDDFRVFGLSSFYLSKEHRELAKVELAKVDWTKQPKLKKLKYTMPVWLLRIIFRILKTGSKIKQFLNKIL